MCSAVKVLGKVSLRNPKQMSHFAHYSAGDARNVALFPDAFAVCQSQSKC